MIKIDMGSNALNDAAWKLLDEIQIVEGKPVSAILFNNLKPCLKAAIETYLNEAFKKEFENFSKDA